MRLYLVQHGDALSKQADPQRPLSEAGRRQVAAMGRLLASAGIRPTRVVHSGKRRAQETAELLAAACAAEEAAAAMAGLGPKDPGGAARPRPRGWATDTMLVGHLPFLAGSPGVWSPATRTWRWPPSSPGRCCASSRQSSGAGRSLWMVRPELVAREA